MEKKISSSYNTPIKYWHDESFIECERPQIIIRDMQYKPSISNMQNQISTVQFIAN